MSDECYVVGIGTAIGGQQPLNEFFIALDADLPIAIVLVSHTQAHYLKKIEETLRQKTRMKIVTLEQDLLIEKGTVYILPEKFSVRTKGGVLQVTPRRSADENIIDIFFESLAMDYKEMAVGIILSGKGKDGVNGALKISSSGGHVFVQEPLSALYQSLPREVIKVDHPEKVLPAVRLAALINKQYRKLNNTMEYKRP
jgi:chemotaxis response regulator CheB